MINLLRLLLPHLRDMTFGHVRWRQIIRNPDASVDVCLSVGWSLVIRFDQAEESPAERRIEVAP